MSVWQTLIGTYISHTMTAILLSSNIQWLECSSCPSRGKCWCWLCKKDVLKLPWWSSCLFLRRSHDDGLLHMLLWGIPYAVGKINLGKLFLVAYTYLYQDYQVPIVFPQASRSNRLLGTLLKGLGDVNYFSCWKLLLSHLYYLYYAYQHRWTSTCLMDNFKTKLHLYITFAIRRECCLERIKVL